MWQRAVTGDRASAYWNARECYVRTGEAGDLAAMLACLGAEDAPPASLAAAAPRTVNHTANAVISVLHGCLIFALGFAGVFPGPSWFTITATLLCGGVMIAMGLTSWRNR